jgi:DNA-binding NarL/FixJ family response regulator
MRILVADTQVEVRSALRLLLEHESGIRVIGEAADDRDLVALAETVQPNVVLFDWELPGSSSAELLRELRFLCRHTTLMAMSWWPEVRQEALAAGADGFVSKPPEQLLRAVYTLGVEGET